MNTIDTKLLLNGLRDIKRFAHDAFGETDSKEAHTLLDDINNLANLLRDHIELVENLNYRENMVNKEQKK